MAKTRFQKNCLKIALACWLIVISVLLQGCFTNWSKKDKALFWASVGLNVVDGAQSFKAIDDPNLKEMGPLMQSKGSVVLVKIAVIGLTYWIADSFPQYRTTILGTEDVILTGVVGWNFIQIGKN